MNRNYTQLVRVALALLVVVACSDKRQVAAPTRETATTAAVAPITAVAEVQYDGQTTETLQMYEDAGRLFLTGKPYGFSQWDVASNPESPLLTSAFKKMVSDFSPGQANSWLPDDYGSGALLTLGNLVLTSGSAGLTVIDVSSPDAPIEVRRYPSNPKKLGTSSSEPVIVPRDSRFQYKALAFHPTKNFIYGFREQDSVYTLSRNGADLTLAAKTDYNPGSVTCCVMGAANYGDKIFVAFRSHLRVYVPKADGALGDAVILPAMQAVNVVSTPQYLYVHHEPSAADGAAAQNAAGIYVFDYQGRNVAFFGIRPMRFAVSASDSHILANEDNARIKIYRIDWTKIK